MGRAMRRYGARALLGLAIAFHASMLLSWRLGFYHRLTFDATATHGRRGWDFYALYQAGHNLRTGVSAYESDDDKIQVVVPVRTPYRYLPFMAGTLGVLLSRLPPLWAFRLWVICVELVLLSCAYLSWRLGRDALQRAILAAMWLCFTPYYLELYLGQFSLVQAALIYGMMLCYLRPAGRTPSQSAQAAPAARARRTWLHDLLWTLSLLWKQNTALFIPTFVRLRRWRALALGACAMLLTTLPHLLRYPSSWAAFAANLVAGAPTHQLGNLGVRQFLLSLVSALSPALPPSAHLWLGRLWVGGVLAVALWLTCRDREPDPALHLCLWTATYFLIYHHVWEHHYVMLLPVYAALYWRRPSAALLGLYMLTAIWTPYIFMDPGGLSAYHMPMRWTPLEPRALDVLYHASKALPVLALWGYVTRRIRARGRTTGLAGR